MAEEITAPLAGNILSIMVEAGEKVEEDAEILMIEAMKMETPVYAPCAGTIMDIKVKEGAEVEEDAVLAIIETSQIED